MLRLFGGEELDEMMAQAQLADLLGVGPDELGTGSDDDDVDECPRPSDIVRSPAAVEQTLDHAAAHDWMVRVALESKRGDPVCVNAFVEKVAAGQITLWSVDEDDELKVRSSEIEWARVLTQAEEDGFVEDGEAGT